MFAEFHELVAGGNDRRVHFAPDRDLTDTLRRQQRQGRRANALACRENLLPFAEIAAATPHKLANIDIHI